MASGGPGGPGKFGHFDVAEYGGLFVMMRRTAYVTKIQHFEKRDHFCM